MTQELYNQLNKIEDMLQDVNNQMQKLRDDLVRASYEDTMLQMRKSYEHPWYKYKREVIESCGDS